MLRSRMSTGLKQCGTILREGVGSAVGIRDICSLTSFSQVWTALGHRTSRYAGDSLRTKGYRTNLVHQQMSGFHKVAIYDVTGTTLQQFEGKGLPFSARGLNTQAALLARQRSMQDELSQRNLTRQEAILRSRTSTGLKQCGTILREGVGSAVGIRDICSLSLSQVWTALGHRTSRYAGDRMRTLGYRINLVHQVSDIHGVAIYNVTGTTLQPFEGKGLPFSVRSLSTQAALLARQRSTRDEPSQRNLTRQEEDPFDAITDKIPERPVSVAEGASYSVVILLGLAIAGTAAYAVFKELIFEPKEYKIFGKALDRVQHDNQVSARLGSPVTGYGQESRNRAARQRISNRVWTDEAGIEHVEVMFHIRGPGGAGRVYSEMFKDPQDKTWKYTYLIVDVTSPSPIQLMLESYVPPLVPLSAL